MINFYIIAFKILFGEVVVKYVCKITWKQRHHVSILFRPP